MEIFDWYIIELAAISALFSLFLDFCFREGNIFAGWIDFLIDAELPESVTKDLKRSEKDDLMFSWWYKPLGGCVVCMNVWISFAMCLFFYHDWKLILVVLLSSFFVRLFHERLL